MNETALRSTRLALASLLLTALASQLLIGMTDNGLTVIRFLSFFTVLSNLMAVATLVTLAFRPGSDSTQRFAMFRGAVTVYMSVTALVWAIVLAPNYVDVAVPEPWIDLSIHVIGPVLIIFDWFLNPPPVRLDHHVFVYWMIFPAIYLAYSLIRGPIVGWYPYPFLDPNEPGGYVGVTLGSAIVLIVIGVFSYLYFWWSNRSLESHR